MKFGSAGPEMACYRLIPGLNVTALIGDSGPDPRPVESGHYARSGLEPVRYAQENPDQRRDPWRRGPRWRDGLVLLGHARSAV